MTQPNRDKTQPWSEPKPEDLIKEPLEKKPQQERPKPRTNL